MLEVGKLALKTMSFDVQFCLSLQWLGHIIIRIAVIIQSQGPHSFSFFELKTFLQVYPTYCKKFATFLRKLKIH